MASQKIKDYLLDIQPKVKFLSDILWQVKNIPNKKHNLKPIVIISGPSGAGKDSAVRLLDAVKFEKVKTVTTRKPRPSESKDYYYWLSKAEFMELMNKGEFIEYAKYDDCYYGTWRQKVEDILQRDKIPVFIINPEGARNFLNLQKNGERLFNDRRILYFYITPPTTAELKTRLMARAILQGYSPKEANEKTYKRFQASQQDLTYISDAEFVVINNDGELRKVADQIEKVILGYC